MKAILSVFLLAATAVSSANQVTPAPDTLHVDLKQGDDQTLQVTVTNLDGNHFYMQDPTEAFSNPQEDTYRFISEPVPGAATFHGVIRGSIGYRTSVSDGASGDWDRLHRWKEVALNAMRVPANGGTVSFNVTPTDHVEFSTAGIYTMSMGLTLTALSPDKSKILRHHMATNSVNMTMAAPTSTHHNEQLSRRALQGGANLTCSTRHLQLVDAWVQQALFSVKDAQGEALGGKFHGKYKDDINFCYGPKLNAKNQIEISEGLVKLHDLLDPKGTAKFLPFCDLSNSSPDCKADGAGNASASWFQPTPAGTEVTFCGSFFYATSHCAYEYRSSTNQLAGLLVRSLGISKTFPRERLEKLLPDFETTYNPVARINKELSADERLKFTPAWECFLARRSKDPVINKDACRSDEQHTATPLGIGMLQNDIAQYAKTMELPASVQGRRLSTETEPESIDGRRRLIAGKTINGLATIAVPVFTKRSEKQLFWDPWGAAVMAPGTATGLVAGRLGLPFLPTSTIQTATGIILNGNDKILNNIIGLNSATCENIKQRFIQALGAQNSLPELHNALKNILAVAAGTGVFDLTHGPQAGNLPTLIKAIVGQYNGALKLKMYYGLFVHYKCPSVPGNRAEQILGALDLLYSTPEDVTYRWTAQEPYAAALARATVVSLLGAFYHDYSQDFDLSADQLMNHAIHRMNDPAAESVAYKNQVLFVLTRAYNAVFQVATAMMIGTNGLQTPKQYNELGLHNHFLPAPYGSGRIIFDELMTNIHVYYIRRNLSPAVAPLVPATIAGEFDLQTLTKRMKRQEVREMHTARWNDYVTGIGRLMDNGMYAKLIAVHGMYSGGRRIHANPRFLPWHRALLLIYDAELSIVMGKPIRAPYWDWTIDSGTMDTSAMFTPSYFGSWGTTALDNEGILGVFGEFPGSAVRAHGSGQSGYPTLLNRCLTPGHPLSMVRNYDAAGRNRCVGRGPRYNPFTGNPLDPTPKTLLDVMAIGFDDPESSAREIGKSTHPFFARVGNRAPDENDFMLLMEQYLHDPVHDGVGGDMALTPQSSADPIFWSHHAMIDNVWASWQAKGNAKNTNVYDVKDWTYSNFGDANQGDRLSQGLKPADGKKNIIPPGTQRDFKSTDWMVFFGQFFDHDGGTGAYGPTYFEPNYFGFARNPFKEENWTVKELMDDRHMYRTFQYAPRQAQLRAAAGPLVGGLV